MMRRRETTTALLFASPWILGFTIFMIYPLISSLYHSFTSYSVLRPPVWVGLDNYRELFSDSVFYIALVNTLLYALGAVPLATVAAIGLALLLNTKVKGLALYRTLFFLPSLVPMVALGTLFLWIFNSDYGLINEAMRNLKVPAPNWLGDPAWSKWTLVLISVWGCGQAMVIYLAGLQEVPTSLYEAAELDGAKVWSKVRNVTLPLISPVILFNVIMGLIGSIQVFAVPYVMFPGGAPARSTYFFTTYLFDNAFQFQRMGYASALGWVMFAITLILTRIALKLSDRHVHYEGS